MLGGTAGGVALLCVPFGIALSGGAASSTAQVAFFGDRPIVDRSGQLPTYRAPSGFRGSGPLASADEARIRFLSPFLT